MRDGEGSRLPCRLGQGSCLPCGLSAERGLSLESFERCRLNPWNWFRGSHLSVCWLSLLRLRLVISRHLVSHGQQEQEQIKSAQPNHPQSKDAQRNYVNQLYSTGSAPRPPAPNAATVSDQRL